MPASPLSVYNLSHSVQPAEQSTVSRQWSVLSAGNTSTTTTKPPFSAALGPAEGAARGPSSASSADKHLAVEAAAHRLEAHLQTDSRLPTLDEKLRISSPTGVATVSGLHEYDYPSLTATAPAAAAAQLLVSVRHLPLPEELVQRLAHVQRSCAMGVLDDGSSGGVLAGRAWLAADSDLYVWRLEAGGGGGGVGGGGSGVGGGDVLHYDALTDSVLTVVGVPVRAGVFHAHITHLLCVTLPLEVVLLGVSVTPSSSHPSALTGEVSQQLQLLPEPIFSVASDGVQLGCVAATRHGRIFLGGGDGCLYELEYGGSTSSSSSVGVLSAWLGGLSGSTGYCRKINHTRSLFSVLVPTFVSTALFRDDPLLQISVDNTRHLLYTRSHSSHVRAYHLGWDGAQLQPLADLSLAAIVSAARTAAPTVDASNFRPLVDVAAVSNETCSCIHLVATTVQGVRLYFSTASGAECAGQRQMAAPSCLRLVHVRLPPGFAANTAQHQRPSQLHSARHLVASGGGGDDTVALMIAAQTADSDALWLLSGQHSICQQQQQQLQQLAEQYCTLPMRMRVWDVCELSASSGSETDGVGSNLLAALGSPRPPLAVIQHMLSPRRLAAISAQGVQLLELLRPVDRLRSLLEQWQPGVSHALLPHHQQPGAAAVPASWSRLPAPGDASSQLLPGGLPSALHALLTTGSAADAVQVLADCVLLACCDGGDAVSSVGARAARILLQYGGQPMASGMIQTGVSTAPSTAAASPSVMAPGAYHPLDRSMLQMTFRPQQMSTPRQEMSSPTTAGASPVDGAIPMSPLMSSPRPYHPLQQYQQQQQQQQLNAPPPSTVYSLRHDALYLYTSRLLRPLWSTPIVRPIAGDATASSGGETAKLTSSFSSDELAWVCGRLSALEQFVRRHMSLSLAPGATSRSTPGGVPAVDTFLSPRAPFAGASVHQLQRRMDSLLPDQSMQINSPVSSPGIHDAVMSPLAATSGSAGLQPTSEASSVASLLSFVGHAKEVIGLMKIIADHQTHVVTDALDSERRSALCSTLYGHLLATPEATRRCCSLLIDTLVSRYLDDDASTGAITNRLRSVCPSLFRPEHAASARAVELLMTARPQQQHGSSGPGLVAAAEDNTKRRQLLDEALALVKPVIGQLQLATVCQHFESVQCYEGVVELVLEAAQQRDPRCVAGHFYTSGEPVDDIAGRQAYNDRSECYSCLLDLLSSLHSRAVAIEANTNTTASSPALSTSFVGQPPSLSMSSIFSSSGVGGGAAAREDTPSARAASDGHQLRQQLQLVISRALSSADQLLHVHVFSWMLSNGLTDQLLQVKSEFLEEYLRRATAADPRPHTLELLWRHYERNEKYVAAAHVLAKLAERHGTDFDLSRRIECLARAILCVKSGDNRTQMTTNVTHGEFLHELEEKLEVARIQARVLAALTSMSSGSSTLSPSITRLNADLLDVTALYQLCEQHSLWRLKLAIVACAGHRDTSLVAALWTGLLRHELSPGAAGGSSSDLQLPMFPPTAATAVAELVAEYVQQPAYLPLQTIVTVLETISAEWRHANAVAAGCMADGEAVSWVARALCDAGVSLHQLLAVYLTIYRQADSVWSRFHCPLHLLEVIINLLDMFATTPTLLPANQRMAFRSECLDAVSVCVNELNASGDSAAAQLLRRLMGVQASLQRIVSG